MLYTWLKIIHVVSSAVLFGTGLGTAFYMFYANLQKDLELVAKATAAVVIADWLFTASSGIVQGLTGIAMVYLQGYSFTSLWIITSIILYCIAGCCWLPVVCLQMRCRDLAFQAWHSKGSLSKKYYHYFFSWCLLGIPAFLGLIGVFYLMGNKPDTLQELYQGLNQGIYV